MAEYIRKDDVLKEIESAGMWSRSYGELYESVQNMQATDVAPVRHAKWIPCDNGGYYCSNCDSRISYKLDNLYCSVCGARMDGDCHADD